MISSVNTVAAAHRPRKASFAAASAPAPAASQDSVDFGKIDSPVKAALLPVTEPAVQIALAVGLLNTVAMAKGAGGGVPLIGVDAAIQAGDKLTNVSYQLDLKNQESPLAGSGDVAGQALTDALTAGANKSQHLVGTIGQNPTDLVLSTNAKDKTFHVDGLLGSVETHLRYGIVAGGGGFKGMHVDGTLGGIPYTADNLLDATAAEALAPPKKSAAAPEAQDDPPEAEASMADAPHKGLPAPEAAGAMSVRGKLGDQAISKDYTLTAQQTSGGIDVVFAGKGTTAGVPESVKVTMHLIA